MRSSESPHKFGHAQHISIVNVWFPRRPGINLQFPSNHSALNPRFTFAKLNWKANCCADATSYNGRNNRKRIKEAWKSNNKAGHGVFAIYENPCRLIFSQNMIKLLNGSMKSRAMTQLENLQVEERSLGWSARTHSGGWLTRGELFLWKRASSCDRDECSS